MSLLYKPEPPWVVLDIVRPQEEQWTPTHLYWKEKALPVIRVLRGNKMRTRQGLMDEFGAALQFFEGFGENWHALEECLSYLDEWLQGDAYILVITNPLELLVEDEEELKWFFKVMNNVGEWWSRPIVDNDRYNRDPIPFHTVLRCKENEITEARRRFKDLPILDRAASEP